MRTARLALAGLLALASLSLVSAADAAAIGTASPDTVGNDGSKTIVVTASGFYPAAQEKVVLRPEAGSTADLPATVTNKSACSGVTVPGVTNGDCGTQLSVAVDTTNAPPGLWDVVETQTDQSKIPSVDRTRILATVTVYSQPAFAAAPLSPSAAGQGARSALVTISGSGFADGTTADFGAGTAATGVQVQSPTVLTVSVAVAADAVPGARNVTLTSADGKAATASGAFTVTQGPVVTEVIPAKVVRGATASITVKGAHFVTGDGFALTLNGLEVTKTAVSAAGDHITADVTASGTAPYGLRGVRVRNPDAGEFVLDNAFAVLAPPGAPRSVGVTAGDTSAVVRWTAPADPGSSPVTGYTVTASDSAVAPVTVAAGVTSATMTGLTNGSPYTFMVRARNDDAGPGTSATSAPATPRYATTLSAALSRSTATGGQDVLVAGRLTRTATGDPIGGATVTVTFHPQEGASFVRTLTTDSDGHYRSVLRSTYTTSAVAAWTGRADEAANTALTVVLRVAARVSVSSPRSGSVSSAATPVTVVGSVSPNKSGRVVGLYNGARLIGKATVASNGSYRLVVRPAAGNYRLVVRISTTPGNLAGTSPAFILSRR